MAVVVSSRCMFCKHRKKDDVVACEAFPEIIPVKIFLGKVLHDTDFEGDHGIHFELDPDLPESDLAYYKRVYGKEN